MNLIITVLFGEMQKGFRLMWSYRYNLLAELFGIGIIFIGVSFLLGRGEMESAEVTSTLIGYLIWFFGSTAIADMSYYLNEEARAGTVEQMFMSPVPMGFIIFARVLTTMLTAIFQLILVAIALMLVMNIRLPLSLEVIPVFFLTTAGLLGFGFFVGGVTLLYKQTYSITSLIENMLIFLTGALVPVSFFPGWLEFFSKLLPGTQGIIVLRHVMLDNQSLMDAWSDNSLVSLLIGSSIYFIGGWLFFMWCEGIARRQGSLGQY